MLEVCRIMSGINSLSAEVDTLLCLVLGDVIVVSKSYMPAHILGVIMTFLYNIFHFYENCHWSGKRWKDN